MFPTHRQVQFTDTRKVEEKAIDNKQERLVGMLHPRPVARYQLPVINYSLNASMMPLKSAAFKAAPPIKPPSTSGLANNSLAFEGLQLPP